MKSSTEYTQASAISFDAVSEKFLEEAESLIPDDTIKQVLEEENTRFQNAAILGISPARLVGNNTLRHCKDLLRQKQPFPFLYSALCFLTEVSILMLIFGIAMGIYGKLATQKGGFFAPFSFLYELILFSGIVACHTLYQKQFFKILAVPFSKKNPPEQEKKDRINHLKQKRLLSLCAVLALMAFCTGIVFFFNLHQTYTIKMQICFFAYAACMVLFGIHNVIYNSHVISFFTIGFLAAIRRPANEILAATEQYLDLSRKQLLSLSHKTLEDYAHNPELADKLDASIRARMTTGRIYYILAVFILLVLDIACIGSMRSMAAPALFVFFVFSVLLTILLSAAFLAANHIIKYTKK